MRPVDYYSILLDAIQTTERNSAQLRALVYERARFNLKREVLFGYSSVDLADTVRKIDEFERAVARIEANAVDEVPDPHLYDQSRRAILQPRMSSSRYCRQNLLLHFMRD